LRFTFVYLCVVAFDAVRAHMLLGDCSRTHRRLGVDDVGFIQGRYSKVVLLQPHPRSRLESDDVVAFVACRQFLENELNIMGIRLNQTPPNITYKVSNE
jgi:hypothetical protein